MRLTKLVLSLTLLAITLVAGLVWLATDLARAEKTTRDAMRQKLNYAQGGLEGLTMDKFDPVITNAVRLRNLSQTNVLLAARNPSYLNHATNFFRRLDSLIQAAKAENLEGVPRAYQDVT